MRDIPIKPGIKNEDVDRVQNARLNRLRASARGGREHAAFIYLLNDIRTAAGAMLDKSFDGVHGCVDRSRLLATRSPCT